MGKFSGKRPTPTSPVRTVRPEPGAPPVTTYEGAQAVGRDARSDLFVMAATNMVGEDTFYEGASERDARFRGLARAVAEEDPAWVLGFVPFLRTELLMRSASVVLAAEAADVWRSGKVELPDGVSVRRVVASALQRADEPGEFVAYWRSRFGRAVPGGVQRGLSDAMGRLITERSAIKYDGQRGLMRLGDVVEIVHPTPVAPWQRALYAWLLDRRRHQDDNRAPLELLPTVAAFEKLRALPAVEQRAALLMNPARLGEAGLTWEYLAGLGPMDAGAWEAVIPVMGYMALLRNLRNFDEAGVSGEVATQVCARLADPDQVARSRQLPFRFLSAYKSAPSLRWGAALDAALALSCGNMPELPGRTLVLIDTSASMRGAVSARSTVRHIDASAVLGMALARRNGERVDLIGFADGAFSYKLTLGGGLLREIEAFDNLVGSVGHGTQMLGALAATYRGHDRVVILSDMQAHPYLQGVRTGTRSGYDLATGQWVNTPAQGGLRSVVPEPVPVFAVNTAGYGRTPVAAGEPGLHEIAGFSDRLFSMIPVLSAGRSADWPFAYR